MSALCVNEIFCWNCPLSRYLAPRGCRDPNVNGGNVNLVPESMTALVAFNQKGEGVLQQGHNLFQDHPSIFSCPGQLNNWHCLSVGRSVGRSEPTNNQSLGSNKEWP